MSRTLWQASPLALALVLVVVLPLLAPGPAIASAPPATPVIASPQPDDVAPGDVHMEIGAPFHDPDGDAHVATDWEIRAVEGDAVVWAAYDSSELVHAHFSDGQFMGPLAGKDRLDYRTTYLFRARFRDSSGAWSAWAERQFRTARVVVNQLIYTQAVLDRPLPIWTSDGGAPIGLPPGAEARFETGQSVPFLTLAGTDAGLAASAGDWQASPAEARLRLTAPGNQPLNLPTSRLVVVTGEAERLTIYLPAIIIAAGEHQIFWISETGATFYGLAEETHPDTPPLARDTPLPWRLEPGYQASVVSGVFQLPTSLAFVANPGTDPSAPRLYVTELRGDIKVITNDGRVFNFAENLLNVNPTDRFPGSGEMGLIGICLSPTSPDVYATMVYRDPQGSLRNKIVRLPTQNGLRATGVEDVLLVRPGQGNTRPSHQIQQCSFGPDGKLYTFMADGPNPEAAQDDGRFGGKVIRLNPDGSAPTDNPFYDPANPTAPISYQWTKGHRNAFGQTWRERDGTLYLTENGPNIDRIVRIEPGRNYGWDGSDESMATNAIYVWPEAHWSPVGLTVAEGEAAAGVGPSSRDSLFVASAGPVYAPGPQRAGKAIQEFRFNPDGSLDQNPTLFARYVGEGRGSIADLKARPDGLYFTDLYVDDGVGGPIAAGGKIWRIHYTGSASFTSSTTAGAGPLTISFTDTSDVVGATTWRWDFGDGVTSDERSPSHTFDQPGRYVVSLTVTGRDGVKVEKLALVTLTAADGGVPAPATAPRPLEAEPTPAVVFFPEMGVGVGNGFKHFWERHGGLAVFGYPITQEFRERNADDGQVYTVQYFERARFEYHPEHKGTRYETQLGLLGKRAGARVAARTPEPFTPTPDPGNGMWFGETGHTLSGVFRDHWERTGGVDIHGFPISEVFEEGLDPAGNPYLVQYFERARFQFQSASDGMPANLGTSRLGTDLYSQRPSPRLTE